MHLDGYTPEEIKYSVTQMMLKNLTDNDESEILSTIENYEHAKLQGN